METLRLIIIEDEEAHFSLMKRAIANNLPNVSIYHFPEAGACLEKLDEIMPDIIISDYLMPGMNGIEFLEALNRSNKQIPVIMITGQGDEAIAVQAMKLGAWDYLVKSADFFTLLPSVIEKVVREFKLKKRVRSLSQQLIRTQEIERQRLSCDLHDHLAQELSALKISLDTLFDDRQEALVETKQVVSDLSEMVHRIIMNVREMAYGLRPVGLNHLGLVQTIAQYCEDFSAKNRTKVDFFSAGIDESKLDIDTKIMLYRLIQEGLNNIKKHACANSAIIKLVWSFPDIILRIEDNGKGFDVMKQLPDTFDEKQMGLRIMEERVGFLNGIMKIESRLMQGTKILIEVPLEKEIG